MATRGFSFKGLVDYVLALKDSVLGNTDRIENLTATDVGAVSTAGGSAISNGTNGAGKWEEANLTIQSYMPNILFSDRSGGSPDNILIHNEGGEMYLTYGLPDTADGRVLNTANRGKIYTSLRKPTPADIGALGVNDAAYTTWSHDTRSINLPPLQAMPTRGLRCDFKSNTADGYTAGGHAYHGVLTFRPYGSAGDTSGGSVKQVAFGDNGKMAIRAGIDAWDDWSKIYTARDKPTPAEIGACVGYSRGLGFGGVGVWTTAEFVAWCSSHGAFSSAYWMARGSWSYSANRTITDTGCGNIHLSGATVEIMGSSGYYTIRILTPTTTTGGGVPNAEFIYVNNGSAYGPRWRRVLSDGAAASDIRVDEVEGGKSMNLLEVINELRAEVADLKTKVG